MPRVMISYRNIGSQLDFARSLEVELTNAGLETWFDKKNIPRLSKWEDEIFNGIIGSDYVVLCLSPEYFKSETCLFESYIARGYGKRILPIIVPYEHEGNEHEGNKSVIERIRDCEETRGIDHLNIISFHSGEVVGLREDSASLTRRLVKSITHPIPIDSDYDVFTSFRWNQATFATEVADKLNSAGIKTFIHTRSIDVGADWRRVSWNASLKAKAHIVILSPDVKQSEYIKNEILISRTNKDRHFVPILAREFANDEEAKKTIRDTFNKSRNLSLLNDIQWFIPGADNTVFFDDLISALYALLNPN